MEREFKVGDRVRVVSGTFARTTSLVGCVGVVEVFDSFDMTCRVKTYNPYTSFWHHSGGLELVTETPNPTPQKLNSQYLMHLAEVLTQADRSLADKAAECLDDPLEYYRWQSTREEVRSLAVKLEVRADDLDMQEAAQLNAAARVV